MSMIYLKEVINNLIIIFLTIYFPIRRMHNSSATHQSNKHNQHSPTLNEEFNFCLSQLDREDGNHKADMNNSKSTHLQEEG